MDIKNPFEHFNPESLSPEQIHTYFVKDYTEHNALLSKKHTFVEGSRGSGKSMLFKFMEPSCQQIEFGGLREFIESEQGVIGIYINCNTGDFRISEFEEMLKIDEIPQILSKRLITHEFIMRILEWTIKTIEEQLNDIFVLNTELIDQIITSLDSKRLYEQTESYPRTLEGLRSIIANERHLVYNAISSYFENYYLSSNKLQYDGNIVSTSLTHDSFLFLFFDSLRKMIGYPYSSFSLLFDEAGEPMLMPLQQMVINSLIVQRKHEIVSVKVSIRPESYNVFSDLSKKPIQFIHDYDKMNLDSLYTSNSQAYYKRIVKIANRRLDIAEFEVCDISKILKESDSEKQKMKEAEILTEKEYDSLPPEKQTERKNDYILKYARARYFQHFLKKTQHKYTGFNNLVHFSSGITRSFLDPCYKMIEMYKEKNPDADIRMLKAIPTQIQFDVIREYSNAFIEKEIIDKINRLEVGSKERATLTCLYNLIEALGGIYKLRLQNPESRYPRIISFSLRENIIDDPEMKEVFKIALQECFFHKRWYRAKSGHEMLECYILNRRLCPRYSLDITGFQGRIELSKDDIKIAMDSKDSFIKWFRDKEKMGDLEDNSQLDLFGAI